MPTTTTGKASSFITFSRGSLATVTDADGRIKWAPHNLLLASEQFDAWSKYLTTVTANSTVAPNGTTTADTIATTSTDATIYLSSPIPVGTSTFSCWVKAGTLTAVTFLFDGGSSTGRRATFTLTGSGAAGAVANSSGGGGTFSGGTSSITPFPDGWYLCTLANVTTTAAGTIALLLASSGNVIAWGAHLYRSDLGGMQANASAYPMYNPSTAKNLLGWSEAFENAAWVKNLIAAFGSGSVANAVAAPNGSLSADKIVASAAAGYHALRQAVTVTTAPHTLSFYAKAAEYSLCYVTDIVNAQFRAAFNLATGAVVAGTTGGASFVSAAITAVGDGWYRCSLSLSGMASTPTVTIIGYPSTGATLDAYGVQYTGDGVSGIYLWGAQLSDSASLDPYVGSYGAAPSAAAAHGPRLDFDGSTLAARGLLVEETRTNLLQRSAEFDDGYWTKTNLVTTGMANAGLAPDGTSTADKLIEDTTSNVVHGVSRASLATSGTTYTLSAYVKAAGRTFVYLNDIQNHGVYFNLTTGVSGTTVGTPTNPFIRSVGNGWYRIGFTCVAASNAAGFDITIGEADGDRTYTGDGTSGILVWGAQLEAGSFATSYIPNVNTAMGVQRLADVASVATSQFPYSASASSLVVSASLLGVGGPSGGTIAELSASASANGLLFYQPVNTLDVRAYVDGSFASLGTASVGTVQKVAIAYDGSSNGAVRNGGSVSSVGTTISAPANRLGIGSSFANNFQMNGHIRQITYIPRRLSNAELQARTA
jgi:hypothetical protein